MAKKAKGAGGSGSGGSGSGGKQQFGLVGLAVMGENLVLNVESKGFSCAVWNRTTSKVDDFLNARGKGKNIVGCHSPAELAAALERPRKVMLMVKAGAPVDDMINQLLPVLEPGDLIIDGGNSFFKDTERRSVELEKKGFLFIGTGVSGGEEGALKGPAIMPGGQKDAYQLVEKIFDKISAQVDGDPCSTYIGPRGAGHYVKMVHNGIEYGDMQLISEIYDLMARAGGMSAPEIGRVFEKWNKGELSSYLIEITGKVLAKTDPETGKPLVDVILDAAGQKGTGKWTSQNALDLGAPTPTINAAVEARIISAFKEERVAASKLIKGPPALKVKVDRNALVEKLRAALYAAKICSYAQGMALLRLASEEYKYDLDLGGCARIWRGGCIIRAQFLNKITEAFLRNPKLPNLLVDEEFKSAVETRQEALRDAVKLAVDAGIPCGALAASLSYFDAYRSARVPANMIQGLRDYFGAHTYERVDKPRGQWFHVEWMEEK
jgi:6-phosphogluconate dehydrogenase